MPPKVHLSRILGDRIGLKVTDTPPNASLAGTWSRLPGVLIVFLRRSSAHTPNKNWPDRNWVALITSLARNATVIEIGQQDAAAGAIVSSNYVDMRDRTSLEQLAGGDRRCLRPACRACVSTNAHRDGCWNTLSYHLRRL